MEGRPSSTDAEEVVECWQSTSLLLLHTTCCMTFWSWTIKATDSETVFHNRSVHRKPTPQGLGRRQCLLKTERDKDGLAKRRGKFKGEEDNWVITSDAFDLCPCIKNWTGIQQKAHVCAPSLCRLKAAGKSVRLDRGFFGALPPAAAARSRPLSSRGESSLFTRRRITQGQEEDL